MKKTKPPELLDRESLEKLPPAQLVEIVLRLQELLLKQGETIERLKNSSKYLILHGSDRLTFPVVLANLALLWDSGKSLTISKL